MTLSFKQQLNGKPTYFVEKIFETFNRMPLDDYMANYIKSKYCSDEWNPIEHLKKKKHTIRTDASNRWRAGMDIHFVINNRTPNRLQFLPVLPCISVQKIEISYTSHKKHTTVTIYIDNEYQGEAILVNCKIRTASSIFEEISSYDGFDSVNDFLEYFSEDFTGKIIHWTHFSY